MAGIDLFVKSQKAFVSNENFGANESITYRFDSDKAEVITRSNVGYAQFNKKDKSYIKNTRIFGDISLTRKPSRGDIIFYDGEAWQVLSSMGKNGIYTITAQSGQKFTMGKTKRPTI